MNQFYKNMMVLAILLVVLLSLLTLWTGQRPEAKKDLQYSEFMQKLEQNLISDLTMQGDLLEGKTTSGEAFVTRGPIEDERRSKLLDEQNVSYRYKAKEESPVWRMVS